MDRDRLGQAKWQSEAQRPRAEPLKTLTDNPRVSMSEKWNIRGDRAAVFKYLRGCHVDEKTGLSEDIRRSNGWK